MNMSLSPFVSFTLPVVWFRIGAKEKVSICLKTYTDKCTPLWEQVCYAMT